MFLRLATARRMKASYCWELKSRNSSCSVSSSAAVERRVERKMPRCASSWMVHTSSDGRRIVSATVPAVVAGGRTICARSPVGSDAESRGVASSTRCRVEFAISLASRRHQSKSAKGSGRRSHPRLVSTNASLGRLMQSSVTSGSLRIGRRARRLSSSAELEPTSAATGSPLTAYLPVSQQRSSCAAHTRGGSPHPGRRTPGCDPPAPSSRWAQYSPCFVRPPSSHRSTSRG